MTSMPEKSLTVDTKPSRRKKVINYVISDSESDLENDVEMGTNPPQEESNTISVKPTRKRKVVKEESDVELLSDEDPTFEPSTKKFKTAVKNANKIKKEAKSSCSGATASEQKQKPNVKKKGENEEEKQLKSATVKKLADSQKKKAAPKSAHQDSASLWHPATEIASQLNLDLDVSFTITRLFEEGNTIPFLARYRRNLIGDCDAEKLRSVKAMHDYLKQVQVRAAAVVKLIEKKNKLPPETRNVILNARSLEEVEFLYSPYKADGRVTKAQKARKLGLEPFAVAVLEGTPNATYEHLTNFIRPELPSNKEVLEGVQHIIADVISKNKAIIDELRELQGRSRIFIQCSETKKTKDSDKKGKGNVDDRERIKYQNFFNFNRDVQHVQPHQILAINRAENLKFLSVKIVLPDDFLCNRLFRVCENIWLRNNTSNQLRKSLINDSFTDAYNRLMAPYLKRNVRSKLNLKAQQEAIVVFATNLKNLLLSPPLRGKKILAVDPGFTHGCKFAFIDATGAVLHLETLYLNNRNGKQALNDSDVRKLRKLMVEFNCDTVGIGNGKGCREIEAHLGKLIKEGFFAPELDVSYTIVNEQGASIYSVSEEAKQEFPDTDPNLVSAVSIGRRLQDPLSELVKIEPKHLGVGMYQLDVNDKLLESTLNEIVIECVSFVGVDINTASIAVLRKLSGLNQARASEIIEWRKKNGTFLNRCMLKEVKGIGDKTFEQCAGFIRIVPQTAKSDGPKGGKLAKSDHKLNPLDQTLIHPESYPVAHKFCKQLSLNLEDLGTDRFIQEVKNAVSKINIKDTAEKLGADVKNVELIITGLTKPLDHDLRAEFATPLFKKGLMSMEDLTAGTILTGRITNVTSFGSFVDIGVNQDGLIHISKYSGFSPQLGNRVEVKVENVDVARKRISLLLVRIL
ncbi:unnamed protein product [Bemisia tabaci]|uniref:S1 motif domain-containing protein n=1 Tax=Bemisia tabaci TaxID=7038 RepID=A0A9P0F0U4_BEMTA|nr:unnamed protein product [Bemisia tabaci]